MPQPNTERDAPMPKSSQRRDSVSTNCPTVPGTVRVHVEDGTVTLTGSVQYPSHQADAEHTVRPVIGTRHLVNKITVMGTPRAEDFDAS